MKHVLVTNHSQHEELAGKIADAMRNAGYDVIVINESRPQALKEREQAIRWCEVFVTVASIRYQRDLYLLELANYAKTIRKPIITVLGQANYKPSGSLGAISAASLKIIDFAKKEVFSSAFDEIKNEVKAVTEKSSVPKPQVSETNASVTTTASAKSSGVFISYHKDATDVATMISGAVKSRVVMGDPLKSNEQAVRDCQVFVAVLSPEYQTSESSQKSYEVARMYRKHIIPVIGVKDFQAKEWLALAIAGKLYYAMPDREAANKPFYDSSTIKQFCYSVKAFLEPESSEEEREKLEILALDKQLEECREKLKPWPPEQRPKEEVKPPEKEMKDLKVGNDDPKLVFNYIHHEVTRKEFVPPKPLFDARGVPLRPTFDVMCSYQWSIQHFVRDFYMDLHMRNLAAWMDIWGGMLGNINEAMANAIECSAVVVCFLTEKYQESVNCCLEIKYAIQHGLPIIFIRVEPDLVILPWIAEHVECSNVFDIRSISDAGIKDNGIPRINRIAELIRAYSTSARRRPNNDDVTEEVYTRREMLENALYWIHENAGTSRYTKCGRCGVDFDENSSEGCRQHGGYYMGGTILAGRWVCCQQREKDAPGCDKTKHTSTEYKWQAISGHGGCFKWTP